MRWARSSDSTGNPDVVLLFSMWQHSVALTLFHLVGAKQCVVWLCWWFCVVGAPCYNNNGYVSSVHCTDKSHLKEKTPRQLCPVAVYNDEDVLDNEHKHQIQDMSENEWELRPRFSVLDNSNQKEGDFMFNKDKLTAHMLHYTKKRWSSCFWNVKLSWDEHQRRNSYRAWCSLTSKVQPSVTACCCTPHATPYMSLLPSPHNTYTHACSQWW